MEKRKGHTHGPTLPRRGLSRSAHAGGRCSGNAGQTEVRKEQRTVQWHRFEHSKRQGRVGAGD